MGTGEDITFNSIPEVLGPYTLVRRLPTDGRMEAYLAIQSSHAGVEKLVVVKRIDQKGSRDPALVKALLREARVAGQLTHPGIVRGLDVGEYDGCYFLATEYVHGQSLRSVLATLENEPSGKMPIAHALGIIINLCAAIVYAHE